MLIKPVLVTLAVILTFGLIGVAANPQYSMSDVTLLNVVVTCLVFGIPLFLLLNWYKVIHLIQRKKRKELLRIHGYYRTVETTNIKGITGFIDLTDIYYHKMLDCPYLFEPHGSASRSRLLQETGLLSSLPLQNPRALAGGCSRNISLCF